MMRRKTARRIRGFFLSSFGVSDLSRAITHCVPEEPGPVHAGWAASGRRPLPGAVRQEIHGPEGPAQTFGRSEMDWCHTERRRRLEVLLVVVDKHGGTRVEPE